MSLKLLVEYAETVRLLWLAPSPVTRRFPGLCPTSWSPLDSAGNLVPRLSDLALRRPKTQTQPFIVFGTPGLVYVPRLRDQPLVPLRF